MNRLQNESSPYLLQHAKNPVDWYPWTEEAFLRATKENKPIFLSIGYSTCHWCHVMEHESFEDEKVAVLMNRSFVCIKVDREERPDIDHYYMRVCQNLSSQCGWPLTVLLTPEKSPFFIATYIPKHSLSGHMGMLEFVPYIEREWKNQEKEIRESANRITENLLIPTKITDNKQSFGSEILDLAFKGFQSTFDSQYGGFGGSPKFASPHHFLFLLRYWKRNKNPHAKEMVELTLQKMRKGGIFDQIGFGFHRYSTDSRWFLPHFEKMLHDQATLSLAYLETYQATGGKEFYKKVVQEIFHYVLRDLRSPQGVFYSAEDADSEGEEGKFYLWSHLELSKYLTKEELEYCEDYWGVQKNGNYHEEATGSETGQNLFHIAREQSHNTLIEDSIRKKLLKERKNRVRPHLDNKILCDWNALMICAFARASQILGEKSYANTARTAVDFILLNMTDKKSGELHHSYRPKDPIPGNLDDYAFLIWALLELYESEFQEEDLKKALELNTILLNSFWDEDQGAFYFSSAKNQELPARTKEIYDGAIPSGNSVALMNLIRLSRITGSSSIENNPGNNLEEKAHRLIQAHWDTYQSHPQAYTHLLSGIDWLIGPSYEIGITGSPKQKDSQKLLSLIQKQIYQPNKVLLFVPLSLAPFTSQMKSKDEQALAYICSHYSCKEPSNDPETIRKLLDS